MGMSLSSAPIGEGDIAIVNLHSPREKALGVIREITSAGVFIAAIELGYFEDWSRSIAAGEPYLPMEESFFPMWRVERISKDAGSPDAPSYAEQFRIRTGMRLQDQV
jgi:hypothetical protein